MKKLVFWTMLTLSILSSGCSSLNSNDETYLDWPIMDDFDHFPDWKELDGKITTITNRAENTNPNEEIDYYITAKIVGETSLVTAYIANCINQGWVMIEQEGVWAEGYESVDTEIEIPCSVLNGWGGCEGEYTHINIFTSTSSEYISIILSWYDYGAA